MIVATFLLAPKDQYFTKAVMEKFTLLSLAIGVESFNSTEGLFLSEKEGYVPPKCAKSTLRDESK